MIDRVGEKILFFLLLLSITICGQQTTVTIEDSVLSRMLALVNRDSRVQKEAARWLEKHGDPSVTPAFLDAMQVVKFPSDFDRTLKTLTGQNIRYNWPKWFEWWLGQDDILPHPAYPQFKRALYMSIDPSIGRLLDLQHSGKIRWDHIVWGGVKRDAIPPLDHPNLLPAAKANYLDDNDQIFGIVLGNHSLAFPERIVEWHEMANVMLNGKPVSLVYCVLCGAAIAYLGKGPGDRALDFGTSGMLYHSNKLMYDRQTRSLWSSLNGRPVIGPLSGQDFVLQDIPVVRTSWRDWLKQHPDSKVLDIETGFERGYKGNHYYRTYLKSNRTMFPIAETGQELSPKDWVYGIEIGDSSKAYPLERIKKLRVINDSIGDSSIVIIPGGDYTLRAFLTGNVKFAENREGSEIPDNQGRLWKIKEGGLFLPDGQQLPRISGRLTFWFAWYSFYPHTDIFSNTQ